MKLFPKYFLWGSGTSSHQVEGNTKNNWTIREKDGAENLALEAKKKWQKWQQEKFPEMFNPQNYISGVACDHYNRFEEDFDLARAGGHNAHRFSIEWSRIEPEEGKFDEREIEHYRKVLSALRERGMEPFITLWHWTEPVWFEKMGGWESPRATEYFCRYVEKVAAALGEQVNFWAVLNEPNVALRFGYYIGTQPPGKKSLISFLRAYANLLKAYKKSYKIIHSLNEHAKVGFVNSFVCYETDICKPLNGSITYFFSFFSRFFFNRTKGFNDFIGCNYYSRNLISLRKKSIPAEKRTDLGWETYPEGMYDVLVELKKYNLPIYITENGLADADDTKREEFIKTHLEQILKAMGNGANVRGYFHWSLIDNFEFPELRGFWPRFGLIEINFKTLERKPRNSFYVYKEIIDNRGETLQS